MHSSKELFERMLVAIRNVQHIVHELAKGTYANKYANDIFAKVANALCRNSLAVQ